MDDAAEHSTDYVTSVAEITILAEKIMVLLVVDVFDLSVTYVPLQCTGSIQINAAIFSQWYNTICINP